MLGASRSNDRDIRNIFAELNPAQQAVAMEVLHVLASYYQYYNILASSTDLANAINNLHELTRSIRSGNARELLVEGITELTAISDAKRDDRRNHSAIDALVRKFQAANNLLVGTPYYGEIENRLLEGGSSMRGGQNRMRGSTLYLLALISNSPVTDILKKLLSDTSISDDDITDDLVKNLVARLLSDPSIINVLKRSPFTTDAKVATASTAVPVASAASPAPAGQFGSPAHAGAAAAAAAAGAANASAPASNAAAQTNAAPAPAATDQTAASATARLTHG